VENLWNKKIGKSLEGTYASAIKITGRGRHASSGGSSKKRKKTRTSRGEEVLMNKKKRGRRRLDSFSKDSYWGKREM